MATQVFRDQTKSFRDQKFCANCGSPFLPTGGNQRYCTACADGHETPQIQVRRKLDRIADLAADAASMSPAMLRIRIQAAYEGRDVPDEQGDFLRLAVRAGVSYRQRNQEWKRLASAQPDQLTADRLAEALAEARSLPAPVPAQTTALYRWWDEVDLLLYIGISGGLPGRMSDHAAGSSWMEFAVRGTVTRYPSREEALDAETAAIKAEQPLFNHLHNSSHEAQLRLVEYLVEHGRTDLLTPAIKRA